jgi:hypothetical protein
VTLTHDLGKVGCGGSVPVQANLSRSSMQGLHSQRWHLCKYFVDTLRTSSAMQDLDQTLSATL